MARHFYTRVEVSNLRAYYRYRLKALKVDIENLVTRGALDARDARTLLQDIEHTLHRGRENNAMRRGIG